MVGAAAGALSVGGIAGAGVLVGPLGMTVASTAAVGIARLGSCGKTEQLCRSIILISKRKLRFFKGKPSCDS
jgi:hypothetical protein